MKIQRFAERISVISRWKHSTKIILEHRRWSDSNPRVTDFCSFFWRDTSALKGFRWICLFEFVSLNSLRWVCLIEFALPNLSRWISLNSSHWIEPGSNNFHSVISKERDSQTEKGFLMLKRNLKEHVKKNLQWRIFTENVGRRMFSKILWQSLRIAAVNTIRRICVNL